jgi:hypothetical protein
VADDIGLFEAIHTQRALRYIKPEREIKQKLGIPDNVDTAALLPLGYPADGNRYGPTNRRPVEEVTFGETWGKPWHA